MSDTKKDVGFTATRRTRRNFIKVAGAGVAGASIVSTGLVGAASTEVAAGLDYDTIVIGGGFAGVVAARETSLRGLRTVVLEARPRLGGRTFTSGFAGHDVDVGGTWLGSSQPHIWSELTRYGVGVKESAAVNATRAVWMDGARRIDADPGAYAAIYEEAANAFYQPAREMFPRPYEPLLIDDKRGLDNISAADAIARLQLTSVQRDLMLSFAAINGHSPASKSSYLDQLRWYALGGFDLWNLWDNLSKFRCEGGTRTLIDAIQADSRAELRMGTAVKQVNQSTDGVQVITRRGEQISARSVIVAVPLNCLSDIEFNPGISQVKLAASRQRHTGSGTKIYARIKGKRPVFIGHGKQEMPLCFSWTEYDDPDSQILCGFGASPDYLDINDDEAVQQAFSAYMPGIEVLESYGYDWNLDPYAKGTWCMYPPGMLTSSLRELQRPEGHVFFAGADIANGWRGFIDGAVESGLSVAHQVTEKLS